MRQLFARITHSIAFFWRFLALMAIFAIAVSWIVTRKALNDEKEAVLSTLNTRAASLIWALEGSMRILDAESPDRAASLLPEIGLQPGVAWIAIVAPSGKILLDSSDFLRGALLYTPAELASLNPGPEIQGRFSPDNPDIYEAWKLFQPGRLGNRPSRWKRSCIFVGFDAVWIGEYLAAYAWHLGFMAALVWFGTLCAMALAFYIHNFRVSAHKLANVQALATQVMENFPGALMVSDLQSQLTLCNQAGKKLLHLDDSPILPHLQELPYYDWQGVVDDLQNDVPVVDREGEFCVHDEPPLPISLTAVSIRGIHGKPAGFLFIIRNLEEIRQLQARLAQSERLASIANLAAGMAHEIRNPLSSIKGYAHFLAQRVPGDPLADSTAELLVEETERINGVLSDVLALAKTPRLELTAQPLKPVLARAIMLTQSDAGAKKIQVRMRDFTDAKPWPKIDPDKLLQALLNIFINAIHATPEDGRIDVSVSAPGPNRAAWQIEIKDTGCGMSEKIRQQIFTPYFTTKASGSGLGLPITRQIIESHHGSLGVRSVPGHGSVFTIILPVNGYE